MYTAARSGTNRASPEADVTISGPERAGIRTCARTDVADTPSAMTDRAIHNDFTRMRNIGTSYRVQRARYSPRVRAVCNELGRNFARASTTEQIDCCLTSGLIRRVRRRDDVSRSR